MGRDQGLLAQSVRLGQEEVAAPEAWAPADRWMSEQARPAGFIWRDEGRVLALEGDWTTLALGRTGARLRGEGRAAPARLALDALGRFDTAGALALLEQGVRPESPGLEGRPDVASLLALVAAAAPAARRPPARPEPGRLLGAFVRLGRAVSHLGTEVFLGLAFLGRLLLTLLRLVRDPRRIRLAPTVSLMERAGLDALPICATTTFFVGATLAFMGQDLLSQYGGQVYTVDLVGIAVLREFGVLVTAIILSGRSASSFAAELGAMRMNQEVDAMQVMGVDPFEALVVPRFLALLLMTPLLTFVAMVAGLAGGAMVVWGTVGLSPAFFLQRLLDDVGIAHFVLGIVKAPVLAVIIAAIGCRQGLEVGGDVESLGRRVTAAVVQALFAIILADAAFAFLFVAVGQ